MANQRRTADIKMGVFRINPVPLIEEDMPGPTTGNNPKITDLARAGGSPRKPAPVWKRVRLIYGAYLALLWIGAAAFMALPPTYEVNAVLALQPGLYGEDTGKYSNLVRADEVARSQVALLESEDVIRQTNKLTAQRGNRTKWIAESGDNGNRLSLSKYLPTWLTSGLSPNDSAFLYARQNLKVRNEPYTNLLKISYRDSDREYAVEFTRNLIQVFTERHFELYNKPTAVTFFEERRDQAKEEYSKAAQNLVAFAAQNSMFSSDNERKLLLEQRSRLVSDLAATRGTITEKESEAAAIPKQLKQMKPVNRMPQLSGLIAPDAPAGKDKADNKPATPEVPTVPNLASDPPLLLVKVYQETIAALVKLNTDLAGLRALAAHQEEEIGKVTAELGKLSKNTAQFEMLQLEVAQAKANSEIFAKRAYDEQLSQDLKTKRLSSVQLVQQPTMPLNPIWPIRTIVVICLLLSLVPLLAIPAIRTMGWFSPAELARRS